MTINTSAEIDVDIKNTKIVNIFNPDAYELCLKLDFKKLLSRFENIEKNEDKSRAELEYISLRNEDELSALFSLLKGEELVGLHIITKDTNILSLALCMEKSKVYYLDTRIGLFSDSVLEEFLDRIIISHDTESKIAVFDVKNSLSLFKYQDLIDLEQDTPVTGIFDTLIAAYLLNPLKNDHTAESIAT